MKRRNLLLGLLAAPFAPLAAKLLPKPAKLTLHGIPVHVDMGLGSDHTSIWICDWCPPRTYELGHKITARTALPTAAFRRIRGN